MKVELSPYEKCLNHLTHNHKLKDDKIISEALDDLRSQRDLARKDAQDWIAVAKQQEQVIDNLEKQVAHLTKDAAFAESDRQEAIKYRTALVTIESIFRESSAHGLDESRVGRLLDAALKLPDGPTVDDEADANGY